MINNPVEIKIGSLTVRRVGFAVHNTSDEAEKLIKEGVETLPYVADKDKLVLKVREKAHLAAHVEPVRGTGRNRLSTAIEQYGLVKVSQTEISTPGWRLILPPRLTF